MAKDKESSFELIRRRMFDEDGDLVVLTEKQAQMMDRWNYAIELHSMEQMSVNNIVTMMMMKFNIERATAFNDIGYAEALFGYSSPINKRYRIGARINYLENKLEFLYKELFIKEAVTLESVLQKYYVEYPEMKPQMLPRVFRFVYENKSDKPLLDNLPAIDEAINILKTE